VFQDVTEDLSKVVITDTALLQFIDDEDRDAKLEEIKKTWSKIFGDLSEF
jgi:hypothetical protein